MPSRIRVLLVGCPLSVAHMVRETLVRATGGPFEVAHVHRLAEALGQLDRSRADVVLVESTLPDAGGLDALARLTAAVRGLRVVLLVRPTEIALAQQALGHGAAGYLVKDDLWELDTPRLVRALDSARRTVLTCGEAASTPAPASLRVARRGRILAFLGVRGGVGTSGVALDTAQLVHGRGHTVALVELSGAPGSLHELLNLAPARHLGLVMGRPDVSLEPAALDRVLTDVKPGFRLLFAGCDPAAPALDPERVSTFLDSLSRIVDVVVLDLPRDGSPATQVAAQSASFVSLVMDPDPACIRQARDCVGALGAWSVNAARIGLVVVHRPRSLDTPLAKLGQKVGAEILSVLPVPAGRRIAPLPGLDVRSRDHTDTLVLSLVNLTDRLMREDVVPIRTSA